MTLLSQTIFRDVVESTRLGHDKDLVALLKNNSTPKSSLYRAVTELIQSLDLQEFEVQKAPQERDFSGSKRNGQESTKTDHSMPVLTGGERRMSFDLMHMNPGLESIRKRTFSKPAEASVSSVNVVTRVTDLETAGYTPVPEEKTIKDKFRFYQDRFKLVNKQKAPPKQPAPWPSVDSRVKALRRTSLVGEHLPDYIRLQLQKGAQPGEVTESSAPEMLSSKHSEADESKTLRNQRIHNLLANSESLYFRDNSQSSASAYENANTDSASDADKEYILPSLFTRSLDDYNEQDVLREIYENSNSEDEDEQEDDDEFLFART